MLPLSVYKIAVGGTRDTSCIIRMIQVLGKSINQTSHNEFHDG